MTIEHKPRRRLAVADREFDELIPAHLRHLSRVHWTPLEIAVRAATLLSPEPHMKILDVGSGIGKLCIVGALSSPGMWCGIEHVESLVNEARALARRLGADEHTRFIHGDALAVDWSQFDALYLYNPFELSVAPGDPTREELEFRVTLARVEERLTSLAEGTRVVTLNGFGGAMPPTYRLAYHEPVASAGHDLSLWIQAQASGRRSQPS
jgi:hypothetical protein